MVVPMQHELFAMSLEPLTTVEHHNAILMSQLTNHASRDAGCEFG
jgi:hypothetical protein